MSAEQTEVSAKSRPSYSLYVTGFGPFAHIRVNPSATVARRVAGNLERSGDLSRVQFTELETSVAATGAYFDELERTIAQELEENPLRRVLLFHVGVHSGEKSGIMRVEVKGYNELFASVPDVRGVMYDHDPIDPADGGTDACIDSFFGQPGVCLDRLTSIVESLNTLTESQAAASTAARAKGGKGAGPLSPMPTSGAMGGSADWSAQRRPEPAALFSANDHSEVRPPRGGKSNGSPGLTAPADTASAGPGVAGEHMVMPEFQRAEWVVSTNAGRYLCNYCLYRSLKLQRKFSDAHAAAPSSVPRVCSVFVHVCDPTQGVEKTATQDELREAMNRAMEEGDNPSAAAPPHTAPAVERYNPSIMEQIQQTERVAQELLNWVMES